MDDQKIKLCSLWENTAANGTKYLSGYLGDTRIVIFKNTYKNDDKQPSHHVYLTPGKKQEKQKEDVEKFNQGQIDNHAANHPGFEIPF